MPRLQFSSGDASMYSDGSGERLMVIDLSRYLSEYYGRLIRQGQVFKVNSIDVRLRNPNTVSQDNLMSASGSIKYFAPTANRKKAWKNAFSAVQRLRRMAGLKEKDYDCRFGFHEAWPEVVSQAWIRSESNELYLGGDVSSQNCIFSVHNGMLSPEPSPVNPDFNGFGFPFDTPWALGTGDMDFKEGEGGDAQYFQNGLASQTADSIEFMVSFAGSYDAVGTDDFVGVTNAEHIDGPFHVMCGVLGVNIDTTTPDDTELQTEDYELIITLDVDSWSSIL